MLFITLHQMRTGWARLIAAGLAIMLGTGFVAASILGGEVMKSAAYQSFTSDYAGADLVAGSDPGADTPGEFTPEVVEKVENLDEVTAVESKAKIDSIVESGTSAEWTVIGPLTADSSDSLDEGALPAADTDIALNSNIAGRLDLQIGDDATFEILDGVGGEGAAATFTITGLLTPSADFFSYSSDAVITESAFNAEQWQFATLAGPLAITLAGGADTSAAVTAIEDVLGADYRVATVTEIAEDAMQSLSGDTDTMRNLLLGFAGVALAVAALVISNTFSVLVAQRTRHLALLRTVGASRGQVRRSVLAEAMLLGLVASAGGVLLGYGVIAAAIGVVARSVPGINLWQGMTLTPGVWITTLVTGLVLTLIAGWAPARAATKVRPLEALRPEPLRVGTTAGKVRAAFAAFAFASGAVMLIGGVLLGRDIDDVGLGLALGILGGFVSVLGVVLGSVFVITPLVRAVGAIFGRSVPATVATMGAVRNPRRTATTTNALFIGVGLVAMMSTGAVTAKATLDRELTESFPIDMDVSAVAGGNSDPTPITTEQIEAAAAVPDVAVVAPVAHTLLETSDGSSFELFAPTEARGASADPSAIFADPSDFHALNDGEVLIPDRLEAEQDLSRGDEITGKSADGHTHTLTIAGVKNVAGGFLTTERTLAHIDPAAPVSFLWIDLEPGADPVAALEQVEEALSAAGGPVVSVYSSAMERESFATVIDTLLLIVSAMLAVAVVIALVGVANTLSLSVLERRRESATLRALGLTTGQLRGMLAIEGVIIAVVGALAGVVGGLAYGWAGVFTFIGALGSVHPVVPWGTIALILAVAGAAGLLASVVPARSAVKVSPVAALAEE